METNTEAKTLIRLVRDAGQITRNTLQAKLGIDEEAFEAADEAAGRQIIRVRGQGGGFFPA